MWNFPGIEKETTLPKMLKRKRIQENRNCFQYRKLELWDFHTERVNVETNLFKLYSLATPLIDLGKLHQMNVTNCCGTKWVVVWFFNESPVTLLHQNDKIELVCFSIFWFPLLLFVLSTNTWFGKERWSLQIEDDQAQPSTSTEAAAAFLFCIFHRRNVFAK